ncbi:MAG: hypothetical protein IKU07_09135 [Oscillospiraceae bacterium]|nr:hypothetical protein [Oscillospiraceae bacterium]
MKKWERSYLQLFAEGDSGAGEAASETGENSAVAGHQEAAAAPRMTWEEIKADPEYSRHMQEMVQARLKNVKQAGEHMELLRPALTVMATAYGLDPEQPDYGALAKAVTEDSRYRKDDTHLRAHYDSLVRQEKQLQAKYPDFNLRNEMQNPVFVRLTAPETGISLEDAYYTVHRREIQHSAIEAASRETASRISNAIRSGTARPVENGTAATAAAVTAFDYRKASPQQRSALKAKIRQAVARGEKLYPGSVPYGVKK